MKPPDKVSLLGVGVSPIDLPQAVDQIRDWISSREHRYVCLTPAHSIMYGYRRADLRRVYNRSGMTTPDGMAVVWLLRLLGYRWVARVYGPDLMRAVCERSVQAGWKHFFYGGGPGVPELLAARLAARCPGIQIAGTYSPPFRQLTPGEDQLVIEMINRSGADIVWVGIGSPGQHIWMSAHLGKLDAPVMAGVGAAFDYLSGRKRQAPVWVQHCGLEWLFRLASEPGRLWRRYIQYPRFVQLAAGQLLGFRKYPLED
jgi:N-acetylglucosaminyldiphosphoundecaprenol N-acetyl-beta-D-mannosaminyltransferase